MSHLTISGDRQTGKTEALLHLGVADAAAGRSVLYSGSSRGAVRDALQRARAFVDSRSDVERVDLANGKEAVYFDNGGRLLFLPNIALRGITVDTHLIDDPFIEPFPTAQRVIRTARR